ncbi:chymotrypsin-2 [Linepithema humile]|uniref:chymotrypsin-2 n=1 Tax=Linepithema humile TaxID=83485 RepID=UPI000623B267|nr:PREDICTED: chymotrypsin-2-like [Linepithema humile]
MRQLACILIAFAVAGVYAEEPERIVNGIPTTVQENPQAISIRVQNNHFCGGVIIAPRFILTAGHCVLPLLTDSSLRNSLTVVTGTTYLNSGGKAHKVSRMFLHERYDRNARGRPNGYDIGLLELSAPIEFSIVQQAIKLPSRELVQGEDVTVVAWGAMGFRKPVHNNLQKLNAKCLSAAGCRTYHQRTGMPVSDLEFCTLISQGTGTCNGDSGSGVVRNSDRTVVGLVSGGLPCALGYPDVYTSVYPFVGWIRQKMAS